MKKLTPFNLRGTVAATAALAALLLTACAGPQTNPALDAARTAYQQASNNADIVRNAPTELRAAQTSLQQAETMLAADAEPTDVTFYANLATQRTQVAAETSKMVMAEKAAVAAAGQRNNIVMDSRTGEVDRARQSAEDAKAQAAAAEARNKQLEADMAALKAKQTNRGMVLTLGDVLFDTGRAELQSGANATLDQLSKFMKDNPERTLKIEGYTDSVGSDQSNQVLSERRAIAVKNALIDRGLDASRISARGYGETAPVASNGTPAGRQQNRRVEIVISNKS